MLSFALFALLQVAPAQSAPSVLDQVGRIHLAQAEVPADAPLRDDPRSLFELTRDYQRLQDDKPGLGFPIAFMAIGTAVLVLDLLLIVSSFVGMVAGFTASTLPIYIALGIIGGGFLTAGIIVLPFRLKKRAEIDKQLEELAAWIRIRERQAPPVPPAYDYPPPPPPPPPPPVGREVGPEPGILLAEF